MKLHNQQSIFAAEAADRHRSMASSANSPSSVAKRKNCLPVLSQVKLAVKFKGEEKSSPPQPKVCSTGGKISMKGNTVALKPSTMSFPFLSLNSVGAIFALLRIGSLKSLLVGDLGMVRTGKGLAAVEVLIELATAASWKGPEMLSKMIKGIMQAGAPSAGAARAVEREKARRADEKLLRTRMMKIIKDMKTQTI